ncbi:hypothetical protein [Rhodococcus koreensis]
MIANTVLVENDVQVDVANRIKSAAETLRQLLNALTSEINNATTSLDIGNVPSSCSSDYHRVPELRGILREATDMGLAVGLNPMQMKRLTQDSVVWPITREMEAAIEAHH